MTLDAIKIVGVGLNKTGTSTLKTCMRYWKLEHASYDLEAFNLYRNKDQERLNSLMDQYESFENWPWALMYKQFDERYPDAKYILTLRKDPHTWFRSLCNHEKSLGPLVDFEQFIYGSAHPCEHEEEHIAFYLRYNQQVRDYFADRPGKLLTVCWETGDGWMELCEFLGRPMPEVPFPHANRTPTLLDKMKRGIRPRLGQLKQKVVKLLRLR